MVPLAELKIIRMYTTWQEGKPYVQYYQNYCPQASLDSYNESRSGAKASSREMDITHSFRIAPTTALANGENVLGEDDIVDIGLPRNLCRFMTC
jgi:hypothetical protein